MKMTTIFKLVIFSLLPIYSSGQVLNYVLSDTDLNGVKLTILFYDDLDKEYEETQFTKFCIVVANKDTICTVKREVWVEKPGLYQKADNNLDNRIGVFFEKDKIYFWLTGFQYGCCLNTTSFFELTENSLRPVFNEEFEVSDVLTINGERYITGSIDIGESWGDFDSDFYFSTFKPRHFYSIGNAMQLDRELILQKSIEYPTIENSVDFFSATMVTIKHLGVRVIVNNSFATDLSKREYGIISLSKLDREFFRKYDRKQLRIIRNELFAFHGYRFNAPDLRNYFEKKEWYKPSDLTSEQILNQLTEIEKHNISLIAEIEKNGW
jgi:hypothetical protein